VFLGGNAGYDDSLVVGRYGNCYIKVFKVESHAALAVSKNAGILLLTPDWISESKLT